MKKQIKSLQILDPGWLALSTLFYNILPVSESWLQHTVAAEMEK